MNHLVVQLHQIHVIVEHLVVQRSAVDVKGLRGTWGFLELRILCAQLGYLCLQLCNLLHLPFRSLGLFGLVRLGKRLLSRFVKLYGRRGPFSHPPPLVCSRLSRLLLILGLACDPPICLVLTSCE